MCVEMILLTKIDENDQKMNQMEKWLWFKMQNKSFKIKFVTWFKYYDMKITHYNLLNKCIFLHMYQPNC